MRISIIIPVYNVSQFIEKCISSVCAQTMTDGVECILVDDCCTDNSMELAEKVIAKYGGEIKFSVLHHNENKGVSVARNAGIKQAKGEYVFFLDSDDWITPDCLETLWYFIGRYPNVDIVRGNTWCVNEELNRSNQRYLQLPEYSHDRKWLRNVLQSIRIIQGVQNQLIKRELIVDNGLYFKEMIVFEDVHWIWFAGKYVNSMVFCKKITHTYNDNPSGIMATNYLHNPNVKSICAITTDMVERIDRDTISTELRHILSYTYRTGKPIGIMGGNFFKNTWLYDRGYFRKLYDKYCYINDHSLKSFKGLWAYLLFEIYLVYTCRQISKHQKRIHNANDIEQSEA